MVRGFSGKPTDFPGGGFLLTIVLTLPTGTRRLGKNHTDPTVCPGDLD